MEITVPDAVRAKAALAGAGEWLTGLPELIAELESRWSITVGRAYPDATEAYVAEATRADGTPAVLKLLVPRASNAAVYEITVLRLAGGEGCVALLRDDMDRGALLVERLGPALVDAGLPLGERLEILTDLAQAVWRPPTDTGLPTGAEKGRWLINHINKYADKTDKDVVSHAIACAERRIAAHDDRRAVLVHGDVHQWNALRSGAGWKLVDPDGLRAEPEYDLGVLMREDPVELLAGDPWDRAHWLADRTGTDATAIWEWGVVERLSTGLLLAALGMPVGNDMLDAAVEISRRAGSGG
jgi:streptomycin 6-kinase